MHAGELGGISSKSNSTIGPTVEDGSVAGEFLKKGGRLKNWFHLPKMLKGPAFSTRPLDCPIFTTHSMGLDTCDILSIGSWLYLLKLGDNVSNVWTLLRIYHHCRREETF